MNKGSNVEVFSALGTTTDLSNEVLEMFVCGMYGKAHMNNVDDLRYAYFLLMSEDERYRAL